MTMFESDGECGLLPEDTHDKHMSVTNKSCLQQHKLSLQSTSNIVSYDLLNCALNANQDLFNNHGNNNIIKSASTLLQSTDISQMKTWRTCLNTIINDAESIFEQALPTCPTCSLNSSHTGLNEFFRNKCACVLNIVDINNKFNKGSTDIRGKSVLFMNMNSEHSSQEAKSVEERQVFKPRFSRQKYSNKTPIQAETNALTPCDEVNFDKKDEENKAHKSNVAKISFKTAKDQLLATNPAAKRTLGTSRKAQAKFVSPMIGVQEKQESVAAEASDERLKHIDPKMIELIESEIIDKGTPIGWDDIAGLELAKSVIQEAVVWPLLRPDIFTGLRRPPKGILLFGPPGTGKTLIGKCIASQCNATFFNISASSLTSKWIGDGEKMMRALFAVARCHQPAVIFIDEIDSLLTQRNDTEHEATRRIKTEFLVQFDGAATGEEDRLLIVGATNRPQELDEAARRRLVKRLYIPLPDVAARQQIISNLLKREHSELSVSQVGELAALCAGYSGADVRALCGEAALGPVRAVPPARLLSLPAHEVRPVNVQDFVNALQRVKSSVSQDDLEQYVKWNKTYGHGF